MIAERERRIKYKKQEEQRESVRQNLRDKVCIEQCCIGKFAIFLSVQDCQARERV